MRGGEDLSLFSNEWMLFPEGACKPAQLIPRMPALHNVVCLDS